MAAREQNALDQCLVASAFGLVLLGGVFTFATERDSDESFVVEVVMLCLMIGTVRPPPHRPVSQRTLFSTWHGFLSPS